MRKSAILLSLVLITSHAYAGSAGMPPLTIPENFEVLKKLLGTWEGSSVMDGKARDMQVVYELTAAGTAITERTMVGTPEEMVSVYHKDGDSVAMTHYCTLGNQPHMKLKKSDGEAIRFEMTKPRGVSSIKEPHMHAVTLTLLDADTLKQEWAFYVDGKHKENVVINLKRRK